MQFSVLKSDLVNVLGKVTGIVGRGQLPILSNVLLNAGGGSLEVVGSDGEVELSSRCNAVIVVEGSITVPARKLFDICRALPEGNIKIEFKSDNLLLSIGKSRYKLSTLGAKDYPLMASKAQSGDGLLGSAAVASFVIQGADLKDLISRTAFAMGNNDARYYLNGLFLELSDKVRVVATDGHRLAVCDLASEVSVPETVGVIIPRKAVGEMGRLFSDGGHLTLSFGSGYIRADSADASLVANLIDGKYPDYQRVIPTGLNGTITANRAYLASALSRASILANEKIRGVKLTPSNNVLEIEASNPDSEIAVDLIDVEFSGESFEVGFNVTYLIDALKSFGGESIEIHVRDGSSSVVICDPVSAVEHKVVVMPMRL
jgi:DNA polymerase III subunit beta